MKVTHNIFTSKSWIQHTSNSPICHNHRSYQSQRSSDGRSPANSYVEEAVVVSSASGQSSSSSDPAHSSGRR